MPNKKPQPIGTSASTTPEDILFAKAANKKKTTTMHTAIQNKTSSKQKTLSTKELLSQKFTNGAPMFYKLKNGEIICSKNAPTNIKKQFYLTLYKASNNALSKQAQTLSQDEFLASDIPSQQSFAKAYAMALSAISGSEYSSTHYISFYSRTEQGWLMFLLPNHLTESDIETLTGPFCFVNDKGKVFVKETIKDINDIYGTVFEKAVNTMEYPTFPLPFRNRPIQPGEKLA